MEATSKPPPAGCLAALGLCLLALGWASPTQGHNGYDPWCCNERDCKPYPHAQVQRVPGGWSVVTEPGQEARFFAESGFRGDLDGQTHLCIFQGQNRCIYIGQGA
jgi:hypothetical protein